MSQFKLHKKLDNGVRVGELETPHGTINTPFFMPVATVGSVKSAAPWELKVLGAEIILSNTYHLYLRPGERLIKELGGLHKFMGWDGPILTDSGGYQVFSLSACKQVSKTANGSGLKDENTNLGLVKITEEGVEFKSHLDGSKHFFTPEKVIQIQLDLGVDILMPLDVCPSGKASREEVGRAVDLTIKWAKRAKEYFDAQMQKSEIKDQNDKSKVKNNNTAIQQYDNCNSGLRPLLHGIVQGGLDEELRRQCAEKLMDMDFDGYSVGGLAVDLETRDMWNIVKLMGEILPGNKQRYLMGVGTPDDIIKATQLGMDMFDCVLPTRMARHGSVYIHKWTTNLPTGQAGNTNNENSYELISLLNSKYRTDPKPIEEGCDCPACNPNSPLLFKEGCGGGYANKTGFSRAYISHLLRSKEILGVRLTTLHNLYKYLELMLPIKHD